MPALAHRACRSLAAVVLDNHFESVDLLATIRALRPDLPVILTGDRRVADPQRLGEHTLLLLKPFTVSELVEKVERACSREIAAPVTRGAPAS